MKSDLIIAWNSLFFRDASASEPNEPPCETNQPFPYMAMIINQYLLILGPIERPAQVLIFAVLLTLWTEEGAWSRTGLQDAVWALDG